MQPYEQYEKHGLSQPIRIKPSLKMHALLWGGGLFLLIGCFLALSDDDFKMQLIGVGGGIFFGFALTLFASALSRSKSKGLVEFSEDGLWLSSLGTTLPWHSIGPAWINTTKHAGGKTDDVVFIAKGIDRYTSDVDFFSGIHLKLMKRTLDLGKGGAIDFGLETLFNLSDDKDSFNDLTTQIEYARNQAQSDPSAILLNIPVPFRMGINPNELVAILNNELSKQTIDQN